VSVVGATRGRETSRSIVSERASQRAFFGVSALLFAASAAVTIVWCASMDLRPMAVVTAAITVERLSPAGERVARAIGAVVVGAGLFLIARAAGLG
jgi:hypothetical protein